MPCVASLVLWVMTVMPFISITRTFAAPPDITFETGSVLNKAAEELGIEISLGQLAVQRANNAEVREFGRQMVAEHEKVGQQVEVLALRQQVRLAVATSHTNKQKLEELSRLSGHAFDREYMNYSLHNHQASLEEFQRLVRIVRDPDIKQWIILLLPLLESHREKAQHVKTRLQTNP